MLYVLAINKNISGGSETLHQFASKIKKNGGQVKMYYPDAKNANEVPEKFKLYNLEVANEILDKKENILLVPETETKYIFKYKNIQKVIWWLSLDNYYGFTTMTGLIRSAQRHSIPKWLYPIYCPVILIKKKITPNYFKFRKNRDIAIHLYNCEYVREYLEKKGIPKEKYEYLCGPIREDYFISDEINIEEKQNIVIYNPKKNLEFTKKIIKETAKLRNDIKFVPIENMTPKQIIKLMDSAKLYIDFGQFPGPERIPREAVMRKCNILTSTFGSANNNIDVLVPRSFKIDAKKKNINEIVDKICILLDNYEEYLPLYDAYRKKVISQKLIFDKNIDLFIKKFDI
ncbi:hypothetical protein [Ligilactobacillus salivarius]|uniref:hypothetical protein n=1 Tax=Ligilactobacillus salivarius TaxID=1624 RepID=UPI0031FE4B8B